MLWRTPWVVDRCDVLSHVTAYLSTHWAAVRTHWLLTRADLPRPLSGAGVLTSYDPAHQRSGTTDWRETSTKVQFHQHDYFIQEGWLFSIQKSDFFWYLLYILLLKGHNSIENFERKNKLKIFHVLWVVVNDAKTSEEFGEHCSPSVCALLPVGETYKNTNVHFRKLYV